MRQTALDTLQAHQEQIEKLGFLEKTDFTLEEIKAINEAAGELDVAEVALDDTHELTLMELETDLAELLQKVMLGQYLPVLKLYWLSAKRSTRFLPDQIPEEVADDYNIGVFNKTQVRLNQIALNVREVSQRRCLNSDDYSTGYFIGAVANACAVSSQEASTATSRSRS